MAIIKRTIFAIPFILSFSWFCLQLEPFLENLSLIFNFNLPLLWQIATFLAAMILTALFFVIFVTLAQDWRVIIPVILITAVAPALLLLPPRGYFLAAAFLIPPLATYPLLSSKLATYLTFSAPSLLTPSIKRMVTLMLLITTIGFYLSYSTEIKQNGFQIPDSLLDSVLKFVPIPQLPQGELNGPNSLPNPKEGQTTSSPLLQSGQLPQVTHQQIQLLKQNPDLLKQYGLDPSLLDQLDQAQSVKGVQTTVPQSDSQNPLKTLLNAQLQTILKPYLGVIPAVAAALFFLTLKSLTAILEILVSPLLWLIFLVLEKTGFTRYQIEQREVKKLVVSSLPSWGQP